MIETSPNFSIKHSTTSVINFLWNFPLVISFNPNEIHTEDGILVTAPVITEGEEREFITLLKI